MNDLPEPAALERARSERLELIIRQRIDEAGGWIGFDQYMQMALHEPGLGYYAASVPIGPGGDFVTAPELGDLLARSLAAFLEPHLAAFEEPAILELGAGTGRLAHDLLAALARAGLDDCRYQILETSAVLKAQQHEALAPVEQRVSWLDRLPDNPTDRIVVCNEVADALPVVRFEKRDGAIYPLGVGCEQNRLGWVVGSFDSALADHVGKIEDAQGAPFPDGYRSEVCLVARPWVESLARTIGRGGLLIIDYGLPARDYYRQERSDGTLLCYYRQRVLDDPFLWPGLLDITAWVDFSRLARAAHEAGLDIAGFTNQAQFLIESMASVQSIAPLSPAAISAAKTLVLPGEMGEKFKLIWCERNLEGELPGRDFRDWL